MTKIVINAKIVHILKTILLLPFLKKKLITNIIKILCYTIFVGNTLLIYVGNKEEHI